MFKLSLKRKNVDADHFDLSLTPEDRKKAVASLNRTIGQIKSVIKDLEEDHACEESLTQLQAARGALTSQIGKLIDQGILSCISDYSKEKINHILKKILKINSR